MSNTSGTRFTTSSPFRYALLLIPFAIAAVIAICTTGAKEGMLALWWAFVLFIFGIATLPLAVRLWGKFSSGGFFLSQAMGLVLTCLVLWTLTHLKLCRTNLICIALSFLIVAAFCYVPKSLRKGFIEKRRRIMRAAEGQQQRRHRKGRTCCHPELFSYNSNKSLIITPKKDS